MADSASIQYSGSVIVKETLEAADTNNTVSLIHSKLDKHLGGSQTITINTVAGFSVVTGLETTTTLTDINFSDLTTGHVKKTFYDGLNAASETNVSFVFAKIEEALSTGTPDASFKFADQTNFYPKLVGVGDFMIIPLTDYNQDTSDYDIEVVSSGASTTCRVTVLLADKA